MHQKLFPKRNLEWDQDWIDFKVPPSPHSSPRRNRSEEGKTSDPSLLRAGQIQGSPGPVCRGPTTLVAQSWPSLCDPMDCRSPSSSVHGISQSSLLEWIAISFSRGSCPPGNWTPVSPALAGGFFTTKLPGKPHVSHLRNLKSPPTPGCAPPRRSQKV